MVSCGDGCGTSEPMPDASTPPPGWSLGSIVARWRCGACWRALRAAQAYPGTPAAYAADPLPMDSIGALKKLPERVPFHEGVKA